MAGPWIMQARFFGALILLLITTSVSGLNCEAAGSISPFRADFANVSILTNPDQFGAYRGINMEIGSLEKRLSLNVGTTLNTTFIPDGDLICNALAPDSRQCYFWRGGVFAPRNSTSWVEDLNTVAYNGSASNQGYDYVNGRNYQGVKDPISQFPRGWDTVDVGGKEIFGYPLTIINNSSFPFGSGMIGLATDSQFLQTAIAANLTPSNSWSLDYGTTGVYIPGELVVGGYNSAKATYDSFQNFTIFPNKSIPCPLQVNISTITLGNNGSSLNSAPFTACVEVAMWTMVLPWEVQRNFDTNLRRQTNLTLWKNTWEYSYYNTSNGIPKQDMTITLDTGFSVTIPANELYREARELVPEGGWSFIPGSIEATMGNADFPEDVEPLPELGAPFLSQVYVVVDYETNVFSLAHTQRGSGSEGPNLVTLGCDAELDTSSDAPVTASNDNSSSGIGTGPIVGGILGGVGGLAIIGVVIFFFMRRRNPRDGGDGGDGGYTTEEAGSTITGNIDPKAAGYNSGSEVGPPAYGSVHPTPTVPVHETDGRAVIAEMPS
ncbi:hypothetical protein RUND412_010635 [Rhizina undulata]